jgi:hypothetical protein
MFVRIPEVVELSQPQPVRPLVRLTTLSECQRLIVDTEQRPMARTVTAVGPLAAGSLCEALLWLFGPNRERVVLGGSSIVEHDEFRYKLIEPRSKVVNDLADDRSPPPDALV